MRQVKYARVSIEVWAVNSYMGCLSRGGGKRKFQGGRGTLLIGFQVSIHSRKRPLLKFDQWKIARVIPLFKSGDISQFSNYRLVLILLAVSKSQEKIVSNRLA